MSTRFKAAFLQNRFETKNLPSVFTRLELSNYISNTRPKYDFSGHLRRIFRNWRSLIISGFRHDTQKRKIPSKNSDNFWGFQSWFKVYLLHRFGVIGSDIKIFRVKNAITNGRFKRSFVATFKHMLISDLASRYSSNWILKATFKSDFTTFAKRYDRHYYKHVWTLTTWLRNLYRKIMVQNESFRASRR